MRRTSEAQKSEARARRAGYGCFLPWRSPLEQAVTLNASLEQLITPLSTPSPSPCFHRRSTVTSSVFAWRFLPQQEPMSSRLPPYFDPTSELYADAIKYVMPDSFSTSQTSAAASLTALARATPTLRPRNATVATPSQTPTHAVTTPTSSAERAPPRKRSRMARSGTTPTVSAPEGALELTRANSTPARSEPIETVVSSPSSPSTGIDLSGLDELIQAACDQARQSTMRNTSATPDPTSHPCRVPNCTHNSANVHGALNHLRSQHEPAEITPAIAHFYRAELCPHCHLPYLSLSNHLRHCKSRSSASSTRTTNGPQSHDARSNTQSSGTRSHSSTAQPRPTFIEQHDVGIHDWAAPLSLYDDNVDEADNPLFGESKFAQVMSRSINFVPKGALSRVNRILAITWGLVEAHPKDLAYWKLLFALPRMLFAPFDRTLKEHDGKVNCTAQMIRRCESFERGEFGALWNAYNFTRPCRPITSELREANLAKTMQADIEDGLPGRAVAALKSDGVAQGPTVPDKLREKCPQEDIYDFSDEVAGRFDAPNRSLAPTGRDAESVMKRRLRDWNKVLRGMHRRKAPAGDGWRIEHLLLSWDASSHAVANVLEAIANHHIPPEVRHFLGQAALMALLKKNPEDPFAAPDITNGIRPIGKTHVFHKVAFRPLAQLATLRHKEKLAKCGQYGAGISAGIEAAPRRLQLLHEHDPSLCTWSKDCMNAFQTLDRHAIRDCLREHDPELHSFFCAYYSSPRRQWYRNADGSVSMVALSCQGVTQGDALSAIIFDLVYTYKVLKPACDRFTDAHFVAIHDDTYFAAPLNKLIEINSFLIESAAAVGLRYVPKKEYVFQLPDPTRPASANLASLRSDIDDVTKFVYDYFRCGGIAVGDPAAVDDYALRAAREYDTHVNHLAQSPLQVQFKNVLFSWCGKPTTMLTYMIRAVAPFITSRAAKSSDDSYFAALSLAWQVAPESFGREDPHGWGRRRQAQLAVRRGGANAASLHDMRVAAYLGSIADTLPTLLLDEHLSDIIDTPDRWSTSQLSSLRQAAAAWSQIMSLKDPLTGVPIVKRLRTNEFYKSIFAVLCTGDAGSIDSLTDDDFPNIANLAKISGLQLQRALTFVVQEYNYECFMADPRIRAESKAAVAACGAPAAGAFLSSLPRKPELKLDETSFRDAVCHHFRLPNAHRIHGDMSRCPCGARPDVDHSAPSFAEHVLGCMQCSKGLGVGNPRLIRHNLMLPVLEDLYTRMGFEFDRRPAFMRIPGAVSGTGEDKLLDFVARCPGDRDRSVGVDLTVIATMAAKYLTPALAGTRARNTKPSPFAATSKAETSKHSKYNRPVASMNPPLKFVAIAFNDYGGIGFEFYSAVVRPYFEGLREKEEEAGGSGWDARKQKSEFLQRVSITIAKGNSRVLDCMRHDWQSSTAPDLVTSTVHNPRTLAATSDPDTHDPTAATPAGGP